MPTAGDGLEARALPIGGQVQSEPTADATSKNNLIAADNSGTPKDADEPIDELIKWLQGLMEYTEEAGAKLKQGIDESDLSATSPAGSSHTSSTSETQSSEPEQSSEKIPDGKSKMPMITPHHLITKEEAKLKSLVYGEIPFEYMVNPEVYSNQYFEIKKSPLGGNGAFAKTDLKRGQLILAELPALTATNIDIYQVIDDLAPEIRASFMRMHKHKRSPGMEDRYAIFITNAFALPDVSCIYFIAARFNHACRPVRSVDYCIVEDRIMEFRMKKNVPAGTELTIAYGPLTPRHLYTMWGFRCACGGCKPLTDEEVEKLDSVW